MFPMRPLQDPFLIIFSFFVIQTAIANSQTLEEVARLEKVLSLYICLKISESLYLNCIIYKSVQQFIAASLGFIRDFLHPLNYNDFLQALKLGQLPSDIVLPGDDASKISTTDTDTIIPPSAQQSDETTAMEEVMFPPCSEL
jgi:hypothetical protein